MENNQNKDVSNRPPKPNKPRTFRFNLYWMYGVIFMMLVVLYMTNDSATTKELGWTEFQKLAQENVFEKMVVYNRKNALEATVKSSKVNEVFRSAGSYRYLADGVCQDTVGRQILRLL